MNNACGQKNFVQSFSHQHWNMEHLMIFAVQFAEGSIKLSA
jgi:hypothetical protein